MALAPEMRRLFEHYVAGGLPHDLILRGPPGFGKTAIAQILVRELVAAFD